MPCSETHGKPQKLREQGFTGKIVVLGKPTEQYEGQEVSVIKTQRRLFDRIYDALIR